MIEKPWYPYPKTCVGVCMCATLFRRSTCKGSETHAFAMHACVHAMLVCAYIYVCCMYACMYVCIYIYSKRKHNGVESKQIKNVNFKMYHKC